MTDRWWALVTAPWALRPDTLLGATLLVIAAALAGEAVWRWLRWPRLVGYVLVGTLLALAGRGADGDEDVLRLAVDLGLALLLFEAGARLNLRWLLRNPALLATSVLEALASAIAVFALARWFGLPAQPAAALALVGMSVSPAVVQRVIGELSATGQVTERLSTLSALDTLYAVVGLKLLSAGLILGEPDWDQVLPGVLGSAAGSMLVGVVLGSVLGLIARRLDLRQDNAAVLLLACMLLALAVAKALHLSTLLVPMLAGVWLRNRHQRPWVWRRQFGSMGGLLVLVLFVTAGAAWSPQALPGAVGLAATLLGARWAAKALSVAVLAPASGLSWRQAGCLGMAMLPVSATAWLLALDFSAVHPVGGALLMPLLLSMLALAELPAVLLVLYALRAAHETDPREGAR